MNIRAIVRIGICLLPTATVFPQGFSFRPGVHLPVGEGPGVVVIADVNRDGRGDILAVNHGSNNISVYLGNGKGRFAEAKGSPFAAGQSPNDIAIGDFNGDNKLDLAIPNHSVKYVTVLLGDGQGSFSFAPGSPFAVPSNPHPHGIAAADFNGDAKLDLAMDSWGEDKVLVMFGNGDGTVQTPGVKFDVGRSPYERLRSADLNGDGHPDIVTSNWRGKSISVLLGDGKGKFALVGGANIPVPDAPFSLAIADYNGDHHPDIAVGHYSGHAVDPSKNVVSVLYGDGRGGFKLAKGSPFPVANYPPTVTAGDVNGDGIADIAIPANLENSVAFIFGGRTGIKQASASSIAVGHQPEYVAIGDLDGDGKPDVVVAEEGDNDILVLFGK